ncbi:hypothetical protein [Schauerella aestuarii]|uniref:hypothetical protein n=1 Tax=Schauerella aestuarii TaxID=2511204 RepID=UPI001369E720|nr:hypothetical protein [Achromobacter aestuarii]MYZ44191.1 hypothetical protein [Achromobacter aestuarii]
MFDDRYVLAVFGGCLGAIVALIAIGLRNAWRDRSSKKKAEQDRRSERVRTASYDPKEFRGRK